MEGHRASQPSLHGLASFVLLHGLDKLVVDGCLQHLLEYCEQVPMASTIEGNPADVVLDIGARGKVNTLNLL